MNKKDEIRRYLNVIRRAVNLIENALDGDEGLLESIAKESVAQTIAQPILVVDPVPDVNFIQARKKHISDLLAIDVWPEALPAVIVGKTPSEDDERNRAKMLLDQMLDRSMEGKRFLDYGCGDGWVTNEALNKRGIVEAHGYDIVQNENWKKFSGPIMTSNAATLKPGYFDAILLCDVLDHSHDPEKIMSHVKLLLKKDGVVYVRCHPWTSRHGSHLPKLGLNKAYFQLFANYAEIKEIINTDPMFTRPEKNPIEAYHWWFRDFDISKQREFREDVHSFFHQSSFKTLLASEQQIEDIEEFLKIMTIQFVYFCLTPKP